MYYAMYLEEKKESDLTGTENYVKKIIEKDKILFFPILKSIATSHLDHEGELEALKKGN